MTDATYKAGIRSMLDGSREALEHAIEDAVKDLRDALVVEEYFPTEWRCHGCGRRWAPGQEEHGDRCVAAAVSERLVAPIVETLRQLITAERALSDDRLRQIEMPDDDFAVLVAKHRARLGR